MRVTVAMAALLAPLSLVGSAEASTTRYCGSVSGDRIVATRITASGTSCRIAARSADVVKDCSGNRPYGNTGAWYGDLSVRNITCRSARTLLRSARFTRRGKARVRGFSCSQIGTYGDGGIFRCTRGGKAMRFSAGG